MLAAILHRRSRRGVTAIEYGLIAAAIIVAIIGVLRVTGTDLEAVFDKVGNTLVGSNYDKAADPYAANGIAPPTGPVTLGTVVSLNSDGHRPPAHVPAYTYGNGDVYSVTVTNTGAIYVHAFADGFAVSSSEISLSAFTSNCSGGYIPGTASHDYTAGTVSIASNGDYVCGGVSLLNGYTMTSEMGNNLFW